MPSSNPILIPDVIRYIAACMPKSVLDIGVGFGKYGVLIREYFEAGFGRYQKQDWQIRLDGIEIFEPYRNVIHTDIYNRIWYVNIMDYISLNQPAYDIYIVSDILEHLEYSDAKDFIRWLTAISGKKIITLPLGVSPQGEFLDNVHETHRYSWTEKELNSLGLKTYKLIENKGMFI